jgi:hypothetical protein
MTQWLLNQYQTDFRRVYGRPTLYDQFMVNMIHHNITNMVVPLSAPSSVGVLSVYAKQYMVKHVGNLIIHCRPISFTWTVPMRQ